MDELFVFFLKYSNWSFSYKIKFCQQRQCKVMNIGIHERLIQRYFEQ